jgi:hypothetical protein
LYAVKNICQAISGQFRSLAQAPWRSVIQDPRWGRGRFLCAN